MSRGYGSSTATRRWPAGNVRDPRGRRSIQGVTPRPSKRPRAWDALLSFLSPSAYEARESHSRRGCLPRLWCVLRFSQPRDAFLPPVPVRACFIPVTLLGLFPSEVLPRVTPNASRLVVPLLTFLPRESRLQGFEHHADPYSHPAPVKAAGRSILSWDCVLSRALSPRATASAMARPPPLVCFASRLADPGSPVRTCASPHSRVSVHTRLGSPLSSAAGPPEVLVLVSHACCFGRRRDRAHGFASGAARCLHRR